MAEAKTTKKTAAPAKKTAKKAAEVKTLDQLRAGLDAQRQELVEKRRSHASGELVNPRAITSLRKEIARTSTAIRAAEIAEQTKESK